MRWRTVLPDGMVELVFYGLRPTWKAPDMETHRARGETTMQAMLFDKCTRPVEKQGMFTSIPM